MRILSYLFSTIILLSWFSSQGQLVTGTIGNNQTICTDEDPAPITDGLYFSPTNDTYVSDLTPNTIHGVDDLYRLLVQSGGSGTYKETYITFDLTSLGVSVNNANINLFGGLGHSSSGPAVVDVYPVPTVTWSETSISYNTRPTASGVVLTSTNITSSTPTNHRFNITSYIQSEIAAGRKIVSFMFKTSNPTTYALEFNSKDHANNHPRLIINETTSNCNLSYQWQSQLNCIDGVSGTWTNIPGANTKVYDPPAGITQNTCYRLTVSDDCARTAITNHITLTFKALVGDPNVYGNNEWRVYGFNNQNFTPYRGYYTESSWVFDSRSNWSSLTSPSQAPGWQGCPVDYDNHSVSAKRSNFPTNIYSIDVFGHDNNCTLYIDGIKVFSSDGFGTQLHSGVWVGKLTSTSLVDFRWTEDVGDSYGAINISNISNPNNLTAGTINANSTVCYGGDPTTISSGFSLAVTQDAHVRAGASANTNYGTANKLLVQSSGTADNVKYTYLMFNLSSVNTAVTSAFLKLYGNVLLYDEHIDVGVYEVLDTLWSETGINFNNRPLEGALIKYVNMSSKSPENIYWDISSYIASRKAAGFKKVSLMVKQQTNNVYEVGWNSKESGAAIPEIFVNNPYSTCYLKNNQWQESVGCTGTWSDIAGATSTTYNPPAGIIQTTCYRKKVTDACDNIAYSNIVTATVNAPSAPTGTGASRCGTGTVVLTASGSSSGYRWYAASSGGSSIGTGASFTTPSISATTTYYVAAVNSSGCESITRTAVIATIKALPSAPTGVGGTNCGPGTVTLSASGSTDYKWYSAASGGSSIGTGTPFTTSSISATTSYFVAAVNSDLCESSTRTEVVATINPMPSAPTGVPGSVCGVGSVNLSATGSPGTYSWYSVSTGGSVLASTSGYSTPILSTSTTFYVSSVSAGCESSTRTSVLATVHEKPYVGFATSDIYGCPSTTLSALSNGSRSVIRLDGVDDYLAVPAGVWFNNNFTVESWVYVRSHNNWSKLIDFGNGISSDNILISLSDGTSGKINFDVTVGSVHNSLFTPSNVTVPLNQWAHIACVLSGTTGTIYLNGVSVATGTMAVPSNVMRTSNFIGRSNNPSDIYPNADIDQLRIWNVARTQAQIQEGMKVPVAASTAGLVADWKMNEGSGTTTKDAKGGVVATLTNGASWQTPAATTGLTYTWSPAGGLSSTTGPSVTASPAVNTTYTVTATDANTCSSQASINFIPGPVGDTSIYGNGQWNAYVFDGSAWNSYKGSFTETLLNFDSQTKYSSLSTPSSVVGYIGCYVPVDNHSVSYKRTNIPAGTYQIDILNNDDNGYLVIDGKPKFTRASSSTSTTAWVGNLATTSKVEFRWNDIGGSSQSAISFTLITTPPITGGTVTGDQTICTGGDPSAFANTAAASGCSISGYQWESSLNNSTWGAVSGATSLTYDPGVLTSTTYYRRRVLDECGRTEYSNTLTVTVLNPASPSAGDGSRCGTGIVTLTASGSTGTYNWYDVATGGASIGTGSPFSTPSISATRSYYVTAVNGSCESTRVTVTATINSIPTAPTGVNGERCGSGTVNLSASGSPSSYNWYNVASGGSSLGSTASFTTPSISSTTNFYVTSVSLEGCESTTRTEVVASIITSTVGGSVSSSATVCSGSNSGTLTLSGHTGSIIGWESSLDNFATAGTAITNTTASQNYSNITATTSYRAIVQSGSCASANSVAATITVSPVSVGGTVSSDVTVCSGSNSGTLTLSGHTGSILGWESSLDNFATAGTAIVNTSTSQNYSNITATTSYRAIVQSGSCASTNSVAATITVTPVSAGGSVSTSATVCSGSNSGTLTLSGHTGTILGWESSLDNFATAGTAIANTTTSQNYNNITATTSYRAIVQNGTCASVNSVSATITITPVSAGGTVSTSATVCTGSNTGTLTLSGHTGSVVGWESSLDNFATAGTAIANTTTSLNYSNLTATTSYRAIVQNGSCASANSVAATITVSDITVGGSVSSSATVCSGSNSGTLTLSGHTGSILGWESSLDNFATAGTAIVNTSTSQNYSNITVTTSYRAIVQSGSCASTNSVAATITVTPVSAGGSVSASATVCSGSNSGTLTLSGHTGTILGWESSLDNFATAGTAITNTTVSQNYSNITATTSYRAIVQSGSCVSSNSLAATITVTPVSVGGTVSSDVTVCSGSNSGTLTLSGHTGSILGWESSLDNFATAGTAIVNTSTSQNYSNITATTSYRAIVQSGSCASTNSVAATITVTPVSAGGSVSTSATVCSGSNSGTLTLSGHTGTILGWESSLDNFATAGTAIANTTTSQNYTNLTSTTSYRAIVQSGSCASANSVAATITVTPVSAGGTVSSSVTVCTGSNSGTLTLSGHTGSVLGWELSLDNFTTAGTPIANTTTTQNYTNLTASTSYRAVVQNGSCASANSVAATITVSDITVGGSVSSSATVCSGSNTGTITLSGHTGSVVGWESSLDNFATAGTAVANTATSLNYTNITATTSYRAIVQSGSCSSENSAAVTITVTPISAGGSVSASATVCSGSNSGTLTLSGHTGTILGWESSLDNFATAGTAITNTTVSQNYSNITATTSYRAIVQSGSCVSSNSLAATITVTPVSVGGTVSSDVTVCSGSNSGTLTLSGHTGSILGWESSLDNFATAGTAIVNTSTSQNYSNITATTSYRAIVQSGSCASTNSVAATITVTPVSAGGSVSTSATVCSGSNSGTLTLSGHTGTILGWESSLDNFATAGTAIANTTTSQNYNNITATTSYRAIVQNGTCASVNSVSATITITPVSAGGTVSSSATVCTGSNTGTLTLSGHTGSVVGWESSLDNFATAGTAIANTTTSLNYSNLTATTSYRAIVQNGSCASANSVAATVTVSDITVGGSVSSSATVCLGANTGTVTLSGHTGSILGWESSLDNFATAGTAIANTTTSLNYTNITATTSYRAIVQSGSCASTNSVAATITVTPISAGGSVSASATVCSGSNSGTLTLSGHTGTIIGWESSLDNFATAGTAITNTTASQNYSNITATTSYRAIVQSGSCVSSNSLAATITVTPVSVGGTVSSDVTVCSGSNSGTLTLSGHTGSILGWESSLDNFATAGTAIANTTATLNFNNVTTTTSYRAIVQNGSCASESSADATITVTAFSVGGTLSSSTDVCSGSNSGTLTLTGHTGNILGWESSLDNFATAGTAIANTTTTYTYTDLTATTSYRVNIQATGCAIVNSTEVTITVHSLPPSPSATGASLCGPGSVALSASGSALSYRWYDASTGGTMVGTGTPFNTPSLTETTNYYVVATNTNGCESSIRTLAIATINEVPANPSGTGAKRCGDGSVVLIASGSPSSYNWYAASSGGTSLETNASFSTPSLTETITYYVVSVSAANCESLPRVAVTATVIPIPDAPIASDAQKCGTGVVTLTASGSPSEYQWYDVPVGGTAVGSTSSWDTPNLTSDITYYVSSVNDICEGDRTTVNVTILPESVAGTLSSDVNEVCQSSNSINITLTGNSGAVTSWITSRDNFNNQKDPMSSTNTVEVISNLNATTSYKAIVRNGTCPADTTDGLTITVHPVTNAGILISRAINEDEAVLELTGYEGSIIRWEMSSDNFVTANTILETTPFLNIVQDSFKSYRVIVKSGLCAEAVSNSVDVEGFKVYTSITPNEDGVNDLWIIDGIQSYIGNKVRIFNRWGDLVYLEENYNNKDRVWNGSSNRGFTIDNQPLPDGTYFYQVELSPNKIKTGYVIIKR